MLAETTQRLRIKTKKDKSTKGYHEEKGEREKEIRNKLKRKREDEREKKKGKKRRKEREERNTDRRGMEKCVIEKEERE